MRLQVGELDTMSDPLHIPRICPADTGRIPNVVPARPLVSCVSRREVRRAFEGDDTVGRIRTIKPESFTDEHLNALPFEHRWVFAGLLTEADREGRLEDKPRTLKARILPYDLTIDAFEKILLVLTDEGFIRRYVVGGEAFIDIPKFLKHQHINPREAQSILPSYSEAEMVMAEIPRVGHASTTRQGRVSDVQVGREGKGKEGKEREDLVPSEPQLDLSIPQERKETPQELKTTPEDLQALWNRVRDPRQCEWREMSHERLRSALKRLKERPLSEWEKIYRRIAASAFCCGDNARGWVATVQFILSPDTAAKALEGQYDTHSAPSKLTAASKVTVMKPGEDLYADEG